MQAKKLAGPEAASQKYDILTAIGCHALGGPPGLQRLALRFITLVTARYDWRRGILHVGQREIARLWSVDERTVKREMAKLRALGWLTLESPARRGRVASYALDLTAIRAATRDAWAKVGEDFNARMRGGPEGGPGREVEREPVGGGTVLRFPRAEAMPEPAGDVWGRMRQLLRGEDAAVFANWFEPLRGGERGAGERAGGCLVLVAPSAFHATYVRTHYGERLRAALRRSDGPAELRIVADIGAATF